MLGPGHAAHRATSLLTADAIPECSAGAELIAVAVRGATVTAPEPEDDDRRQHAHHIAGPVAAEHEQGEASADYHRVGAHLHAGPIRVASLPERADSASMMRVSGSSGRPEASGK